MIDHVALLTSSLDRARERLAALGLAEGTVESFPAEGTREQYLGEEGRAARLLLMESTSEAGPYARALAKRGPGIHHVALRVPSLEGFLATVEGWLLHPSSLETAAGSRTLWLARPGVATLLEVHEHPDPLREPPAIDRVEVIAEEGLSHLLEGLKVEGRPVTGLRRSLDGKARVVLGSWSLALSEVCV